MGSDEGVREAGQVGEEVGDRAAGHREAGVGGVGVGERRPLAEDVETDQDLDVRHLAEVARLDQREDLPGRAVVEVIVILDQRSALRAGVADQRLELGEGDCRRLLEDDVGPGVERGHRQRVMRGRRRGDVDHVGPGLRRASPGSR